MILFGEEYYECSVLKGRGMRAPGSDIVWRGVL